MTDLLGCRVCLATDDVKLIKFSANEQIEGYYEILTESKILPQDGLPQYICMYCCATVKKFISFKEKCCNSQNILKFTLDTKTELKHSDLLDLRSKLKLEQYSICQLINIDIEHKEPAIKEELIEDVKVKEESKPGRCRGRVEPTEHKTEIDDDLHEEDSKLDSDDSTNMEIEKPKRSRRVKRVIKENVLKKSTEYEYHKNYEAIVLSKEEQIAELETRKTSKNYLNGVYKCEQCYKGFLAQSTYNNHMKRHDPNSGHLSCEICRTRWKNEAALRGHIKQTHERKFLCKLCGDTCPYGNRAEHTKWHDGVKFDCNICGMSFSKLTTQLTHLRTRHPTSHTCDICGESFLGEIGLRSHVRMAHGDDQNGSHYIPCDLCGVKFKDSAAVTRHKEYAFDGKCNATLKACKICGVSFMSDQELKKHAREHSPTKIIPCFGCNKRFRNERTYALHVQQTHGTVKNSKYAARNGRGAICEICGLKCQSEAALQNHLRVHTGEKPFACQHCPKKFRILLNLQIHVRTHTGETPYKCETCERAFKHKYNLNRHYRVHTGLKPFLCPHCGNNFTQANSLKVHINTVHLRLPPPHRKKRKNKN
ncbi:unnamed protein product, partial [Leptidea sinapis]